MHIKKKTHTHKKLCFDPAQGMANKRASEQPGLERDTHLKNI